MQRTPAIALLGLTALLSLSACAHLGTQELEFAHNEPVKINEIVVNGGSGDVTVRTSEVSTVEIRRIVRFRRVEQPGATHRVDGATLTLNTGCGRRCSVSYDVLAPTGVTVRGRNGSGDVTLTGVSTVQLRVGSGSIRVSRASGTVEAQTGSGEIRVSDTDGEVRLTAGSGDIRVTDVRGQARLKTGSGDISVTGVHAAVRLETGSGSIEGDRLNGGVTVNTGSGDVDLTLDRANTVWAKTSSGSIDLIVPRGAYRLNVHTGSGATNLGVADDPDAPHQLELRTGSGDITVRAR